MIIARQIQNDNIYKTMFAKSRRLQDQLQSKTSKLQKFLNRPSGQKSKNYTIDDNQYYTRPSLNQFEDQGIARQRDDCRHRNHTESKHNRSSAVTINLRSKTGHSHLKQKSYSISKSQNLNRNKYIFKPIQDIKEEKLLMIREERISKLKNGYNLKNRMSTEKKNFASVTNHNAKFNSLHQLNSKKVLPKSKQKRGIDEQKESKICKEDEGFKIPRFFNYCESNRSKVEHVNTQDVSFIENILPKSLQKGHKVRSMKQIAETPPLIPVTMDQQAKRDISIDWIKGNYRPFLEIFQNVPLDKFCFRKTQKGVYYGELRAKSEIFQGKGFIFYHNGKIFEGQFVNGQKEGLGYEYYPDKSSYLGNFSGGKRNGKGRFQWSNGEVYDGEWKNNKKEGSGIWKSQGDVSYVGEWHADTIQGFGVLIEKNTRYEGEFKNFMKWGNGTMRFQNGETYTGFFKQNLPNGVGDYYWNNGDHYHGEFVNGKRHGQGYLRYSAGGSYRGQFKNDKKSGHGQQMYENNLCYEGQFQNDLKHGWGVLYSDQSPIFQGYWLNNTPVDPKKGAIETIIEEESIYQKDLSKNSRMKKIESSASMLRNKIMAKKLFKQKSLSKQKLLQGLPDIKPFRRACNCQRHRKINEQYS